MLRSSFFCLLNAVCLLLAIGCGSQRNEDFIPSEESSRVALEAALRTWADGNPDQLVPGAKPAILVSDGHRTPGRKLTRYEILGTVPADAPRCFAVKMTMENPALEIRERYVVVGIDPIWIIRYEDYEMLTHWSHPMTPDKKGLTPPEKK